MMAFRHTTGLDYAGPKDENGDPAYKKTRDARVELRWCPSILAEAMKQPERTVYPLNDSAGDAFPVRIFHRSAGYGWWKYGRAKTLDQFFEELNFQAAGNEGHGVLRLRKKSGLPVSHGCIRRRGPGAIQKSIMAPQESFKKKPNLLLGGVGLTSTTRRLR